MKKSKGQKRREVRVKAKRGKIALEGGKNTTLPQAAPAIPPVQSGHKDKTDNHAKQTTNKKTSPKGSGGPRMSGLVLTLSGLVCAICFAVAAIYWGRGGYVHLKTGFYWLIPTSIMFAVTALSAYWYYVVKPSQAEGANRSAMQGRPIVFIKSIALDEPLAVGKQPTITFILANSGTMEAEVKLWNCTSYFEPVGRRGGPDPAYAETPENVFKVAPDPEGYTLGRIWMPNINLTAGELKQIAEGRANLYFYAQGQYQDELGRTWDFPLCRIYHPTFPSNLMNCPSAFKIQGDKPPNQD